MSAIQSATPPDPFKYQQGRFIHVRPTSFVSQNVFQVFFGVWRLEPMNLSGCATSTWSGSDFTGDFQGIPNPICIQGVNC